jgi:hypothetical protein
VGNRNVGWAGLTTGEMMLALMHESYIQSYSSPYDYFLLTGHESFALTSIEYMEDYLNSFPRGSNFMNCWKVDGYDFFGQWESSLHRLEHIVIEDFNGGLIEDVNRNRQIPGNIQFYKSIQLVTVSRDFVQYACHGPDTKLLMLYLANVKTSDEILLPTLLHMNDTLARTYSCISTNHFTHWIRPGGSWHPEVLTLEHLPLLLNSSSHVFARKIHPLMSEELLQAWEQFKIEIRSEFLMESVSFPLDANEMPSHASQQYLQSPALQEWLRPIVIAYVNRVMQDRDTPSGIMEAIVKGSGALTGGAVELLTLLDRLRRVRDSVEVDRQRRVMRHLTPHRHEPQLTREQRDALEGGWFLGVVHVKMYADEFVGVLKVAGTEEAEDDDLHLGCTGDSSHEWIIAPSRYGGYTLQSVVTGLYWRSDLHKGGALGLSRRLGEWESFELIITTDGYGWKSMASAHYVACEVSGVSNCGLVANRDVLEKWELFTIIILPRHVDAATSVPTHETRDL